MISYLLKRKFFLTKEIEPKTSLKCNNCELHGRKFTVSSAEHMNAQP